jgi:uncharacterized protein YceK
MQSQTKKGGLKMKHEKKFTAHEMMWAYFQGFMVCVAIVLIIILLSGCAAIDFTPRPWTKGEKIAGAVFIAAHGANWYTTKRHQTFQNVTELNPVLGDRPSQEEIAGYFLLTGLAGLTVAHFMPDYRYWILGPYTAVNTYFTVHDMRLLKNLQAHGIGVK